MTFEFKEFLNEKALEYLPKYTKLGNKLNCRCPFCGDSKKSSTKKRGWWYLDTATYYCFNCGVSLSGIKFIEAMAGENYNEIKQTYLKILLKSGMNYNLSSFVDNSTKKEPSIFDTKSIIKPEWKLDLSEKAKEYLNNRMVLAAPFLKNKLYSTVNKRNEEYILIPWTLNGCEGAYFQLNDYQKLHSIKYIFPKNYKKLIGNFDNIDISYDKIIVFEGFYDSVFVKNGVCAGTKSITELQYSLLKERYPRHKIVISFDNDKSGFQSMKKIIEKNKDVLFFKWFNANTKQKDINEYIIKKNNPNLFCNQKLLDKLIVSPIQMKLWMIDNNCWND